MINVGIIRYPGSNCDIETMKYFTFENFKNNCKYIWHTCKDVECLEDVQLLVIPGGFAFGDESLAIVFLIPADFALAFGLAGPADDDDAEAVPVPLASGASGA